MIKSRKNSSMKKELSSSEEISRKKPKLDPDAIEEEATNGTQEDEEEYRPAPKIEKNYCIFCGKSCAKIVRHFSFKHKNQEEVRALLSLPVRSEQRIAMANDLKLRGNKEHAKTKRKREFFPCEHCQGTFRRTVLARHVLKCAKKDDVIHLEPVSEETKALFKVEVLDTMAKDDLSMIIHADPLIQEYGVHLYTPGRKKSTLVSLKRKIRLMAKFLEALMHRNTDIECLHQVLNPTYFRDVLFCVKKIFNYCPKTDTFRNSFSSYYVSQGLRFCAQFEQRKLILEGESDKTVKSFLKQLEARVCNKVSRTGPKQYLPPENSLNKLAENVLHLSDFLLQETSSLEDEIREGSSDPELLLRLLKSTLSETVLMNAPLKRLVETITLEDYRNLENPSSSRLQEESQDPDYLLTKDFYKIPKEAKGTTVTLLLTDDSKRALDLSIEVRESLGVNGDNPFLFPRVYHSSLFALKGSICLKESLQLSNLKDPSTNLLSPLIDRTVARLFSAIHLPFTAHRPLLSVINSRSKTHISALESNNAQLLAYIVSLMTEENYQSKSQEEDDE